MKTRVLMVACSLLIGAGTASAQMIQTSVAVTEPAVNPVITESSAPDGIRFGVVGGYVQTTFADESRTEGATFGVDLEIPVNESASLGADLSGIWRSGSLATDERALAFGGGGLNYRYYLAPDHQGFYLGGRVGYQPGGFSTQALAGYVAPVVGGFYAGAEARAGVMLGTWKPAYSGVLRLGYGR